MPLKAVRRSGKKILPSAVQQVPEPTVGSRAGLLRLPALVHSSAGRRKYSASEWADAEVRNMCILRHAGPTQFTNLATEIIYPSCILGEQFIELISSRDEQMFNRIGLRPDARIPYRTWAGSLPSLRNRVDDPYDLEQWRYTLHKSWSSHFVAVHNETESHNGTDCLFELAFQQRSGWEQLYKAKRDVFLPDSPFTTIADIIMTMSLPLEWDAFLSGLNNPYVFASELVHGEVVTFVAETKCKETTAAQRQLTFDLCSAQHQRRALGFNDGEIFGATVVGNNLTIYSSTWVLDVVSVYALKPVFNLSTFPAFIECYIVLCRISDYVHDEVNKVFEEWKTKDGRSKCEERCRNTGARGPWRLEAKPRSTTTSRDPSCLGGGSAQDAMEPQDMEDWESIGDTSIETHNERQPVNGGDQLVQKNVRLLDVHYVEGMPIEDITRWAHGLAESCD